MNKSRIYALPALNLQKISFCMCLVIAFSFITLYARAEDDKLRQTDMSLETALMFALNNNPDIHISKDQEDQTKAAIREAKAGYYPQVSVGANAGREYNNPANFRPGIIGYKSDTTNSTQGTFSVNQLLYDGSQTSEEVARRQQLLVSTQYQSQLINDKIITDTVQAYMNVYRYQKVVIEADHFVQRLEDITHKIDLMVEAGAENKAKAKYAQSRLAFARSESSNAKASLTNAVTELEFLTGKIPPFAAAVPELKDLLSLDVQNYIDIAEKNNNNLLLNASDKEALKHELKKANGQYLPTLGLLLQYNQSQDVGGDVGRVNGAAALVQFNYKLFDGFARDAAKDRIKSQMSEAKHQTQRIQRDVKQRIQQSYNQISALENEYETLQNETKTNIELQKLYHDQFNYGEGDIINLIDGEQHLYTSQIRERNIEADITVNALQLVRQVGLLNIKNLCPSCQY